MKREQPPSAKAIRHLLAFLPALENPREAFGRTVFEGSPEGHAILPWNEMSADLEQLHDAICEGGFVLRTFDWGEWQGEAQEFALNPALVAEIDLETVCKLLTTHVRRDRFCGGHLAAMAESGHLAAILRRLTELSQEPESAVAGKEKGSRASD